jgi:ribosome-associated protein
MMSPTLRDACRAAVAADDKLGIDVVVLEVGPIIGITEAFVIASATNHRQLRTIVDEVDRALLVDRDRRTRSTEGLESEQWVLLDYGDFVVHVFLVETREQYGLERLWADAPRVAWREVAVAR